MEFGFAALVDVPMTEFAARARLIETLGFDYFWIPDERLLRNVYVALSTAATHTDAIQIGTAVTNPYTRNPAITAAAAATIDELSAGRTVLGLGAGGGLEAYGITRESPVGHLRETIEITRRLTRGDTGSYVGDHFSLHSTQLDFESLRQIPIYVAARGPKILELAGEVADGAIIGGFAHADGVTFAKDRIARGLSRSGRTWNDISTVAWTFISVSEDRAAARLAVSRMVLAAMLSSRPILDDIGVDLPPQLRQHLDRHDWSFSQIPNAAEMLTDEIINAFSVHGTPDECTQRLDGLRQFGIDQISFVALPAEGLSVEETASLIAERIIPEIRRA